VAAQQSTSAFSLSPTAEMYTAEDQGCFFNVRIVEEDIQKFHRYDCLLPI
jgi:hypothetical protein